MRCFRCNSWPCSCHDGQTIILGDCQLIMGALPADHFTAIVTDPPYALTAGKKGGSGAASLNPNSPAGRARITTGGGFMGKKWDVPDVAFDPATWEAALRVAKPGAPLLAFGGDRTHHRLMVAIEDAGWEIRTCVYWVFGSGFPKSLDISKAIDKAAGAEREVVGTNPSARPNSDNRGAGCYGGGEGSGHSETITAPATDAAKTWEGYGTALKPAVEICVVAMKPLDGTFAANAQKHGVAGLNIDAARVSHDEPEIHTVRTAQRKGSALQLNTGKSEQWTEGTMASASPAGRWPSTLIHDGSEEVVGLFPETASGGVTHQPKRSGFSGFRTGRDDGTHVQREPDSGSAARFFKCCPPDKNCFLCDLPTGTTHDTMSEAKGGISCKPSNVKNAASHSTATRQTSDNFVRPSASTTASELSARIVKCAESLCDSCGTVIAQSIVAMQRGRDPDSLLGKASIREPKKQILFRNLALLVESLGSTGTIPTIGSLKLLFGSVQHAIASSTADQTGESCQNRFRYQSKAGADERGDSKHPTIKPRKLMEYLCKLVKMPGDNLILDPFCGTGTTLEAARNCGIDAIGIDESPESCADAAKRL